MQAALRVLFGDPQRRIHADNLRRQVRHPQNH